MYVPATELDTETVFQGDLLEGFPFLIIDTIPSSAFQSGSEAKIELRAKLNTVMVLSQTCDIQRRKNVLVCPVSRVVDNEFNNDDLAKLKKRKQYYWFYLPELPDVISESFADFQTIYYVPRSLVEEAKARKIVSLSDWGRHHLGWALSAYLGRPIENR
jgi:hypothetical protein